jgi:hypothetical protein
MAMYLVLKAFTSCPVSLLATTKACVFFYSMYASAQYIHHQHKPKADMYHLISSHPGSPEPS